MNEANLAIARKIVLYTGLLVAGALFLFPHWRLSVFFRNGRPAINHDIGRGFIASPPLLRAESLPVRSTTGAEPVIKAVGVLLMDTAGTVFRINYVRQFTEVAIALLFTFGLLRALKLRKPARD
jgi:hypothetical protein